MHVDSPLVSCVVPVFNGERFLSEALDSIMVQSYQPLEVVVVDDGSTDSTPQILASYEARIRRFWQSREGPGAARNRGVLWSRGQIIAFLDADDLWHPEKLERQMARFERQPELDVCLSYVQNFWMPELKNEAERYRGQRISQPLPGYSPVAMLARRQVFDAVGLFNPGLRHVHDTEWFLRAREYGAVIEMLPDVLVYRRFHRANRSRLLASASRDEYLHLVKASLDRARSRGHSDTAS